MTRQRQIFRKNTNFIPFQISPTVLIFHGQLILMYRISHPLSISSKSFILLWDPTLNKIIIKLGGKFYFLKCLILSCEMLAQNMQKLNALLYFCCYPRKKVRSGFRLVQNNGFPSPNLQLIICSQGWESMLHFQLRTPFFFFLLRKAN